MKYIAATYAMLGLVDMIQTHIGLGRGHIEANPIMATVASNLAIMWAVKIAGICVVLFLMNRMWRYKDKRWFTVMVGVTVCVLQFAVVMSNYLVLIGG